jgi:hypothetical protein
MKKYSLPTDQFKVMQSPSFNSSMNKLKFDSSAMTLNHTVSTKAIE